AAPALAQAPADSARAARPTAPAPSAAASQASAPDSRYWSFLLLPIPTFNTIEGLGVSLVGGWSFPSKPGPIPRGISITPVAHASWSGTRGVGVLVDAPGYWRGWRLLAVGMAERWQRMPYFGIGNGSIYSDSLESRFGTEYYAYSLSRLTGHVAIQRDLPGPFRLHVGAQWRRYGARPLAEDTSFLGEEVAAGLPRDTGTATGAEVRAGLLFDTRDEEASPSRGLFLEAMAVRGLSAVGDLDYRRYLLSAREFLSLSWTTVLAFRQSVELADGHLPHYVAQERLTTWLPEDGFGSPTSLRVNLLGRWVGANKALASVDLRYKKWDFPVTETMPIRLWLLLFADAGRLWGDGEGFAWKHWHTGYGMGARLQFSRGAIFGLDVGWSPDAGITFATAFSFGF
ncbi:MAG: BamA/TamA family outer membrane protein, partial [Gemmatimonadota bacterium]